MTEAIPKNAILSVVFSSAALFSVGANGLTEDELLFDPAQVDTENLVVDHDVDEKDETKLHLESDPALMAIIENFLSHSDCRAASQFVSLLDLDSERFSESTNSWSLPPFFVFDSFDTNFVTFADSRTTERGVLIFVDCVSEIHNGEAMICICSNQVAALEELCFPTATFSAMPVEQIAAQFQVEISENGLVNLVQSTETNKLAMLAFGNVSIRYDGVDAKRRALSLLHAGGVDIPDAPTSSEPESD